MRAIYEWAALLSAASAIGCLIFWGVSISGVLASPNTGFDMFLARGDGRYVVSEHGNAWIGFNLKRAADADRVRKRVGKENIAEWRGPGFLVFIGDHSDQGWLVGGSLLIPMFASAMVAAICFIALRRVIRTTPAMPEESRISTSPTPLKRRWSRFCIGAMLVIVGVLCVRLSWWVVVAERQRRAVAAIEKLGGNVGYYQNYNQAMGVPLAVLGRWLPPVYSCVVSYVRLDKSQVTDAGLVYLQRLTGVQELSLNGTRVTDAGLVYLQELTELRWLYLQNTQVTDAGLANLEGLTSLRVIWLDDTQITGAGFFHLRELTHLEQLHLRGTQVTDAGLVHLQGLTGLRGLYLLKAQVTDAGLVHLRGLTGLQSLCLEDTQVTDAGLIHLQLLTRLQLLALHNTQVTDAGLAQLQGLTRLQHLDLYGTQVTDTGLTQLKKALPNCWFNGP